MTKANQENLPMPSCLQLKTNIVLLIVESNLNRQTKIWFTGRTIWVRTTTLANLTQRTKSHLLKQNKNQFTLIQKSESLRVKPQKNLIKKN